MSPILIAVFSLALLCIGLSAFIEYRREHSGSLDSPRSGNYSRWNEVARTLELELSHDSDDDEVSMRGTINDHWVSVEHDDDGIEIEVNYRSGTNPFFVTANASSSSRPGPGIHTGDEAFDTQLSVHTRTPDELDDYLSAGRRNALLWLHSTFEIEEIDNQEIEVRFVESDWQPDELAAAIKLVVDVADILDAGEKVFMAPPPQDEPDDEVAPPSDIADAVAQDGPQDVVRG